VLQQKAGIGSERDGVSVDCLPVASPLRSISDIPPRLQIASRMHKLAKNSWDAARYALEKRRFIADRLRYRFIAAHTWVIFTATWASGWGVSGLLLSAGMKNMPLRYGLALAVSYPVFFLCVRVWAGAMRSAHAADNLFKLRYADLSNVPADGEGCLVALVALAVGGLLAVVFMLIGGPELLLEVAFEVAFAGTLVRRLRHFQVVGNWKERLVRSTAPFALAVMLGLVAIAAGLQHRVPSATTFAQACRILYSQSAHSHSH
jgi:hypothetical protein